MNHLLKIQQRSQHQPIMSFWRALTSFQFSSCVRLEARTFGFN
eukprot:UN25460